MAVVIKFHSIMLDDEEYQVLVNLVDNAWRMADEYREGREPNTEAETKALVYQLTIERIQTALKGA